MSEQITLMGDAIEEFNPKNFTYFVKPTDYDMSNLKLEGLKKTAEIVQWGRRNPVKYIQRFYGISMPDMWKYIFMKSWVTPYVVWCVTRNGAKTTSGATFCMAKTHLVPYFSAHIIAPVGSQSIEMMKKIESIAKKEIESFTGLTDVFLNELVKSANSEGFSHNPNSWSYKLYSGSSLATVNSNYDAFRGKRSRLNFYDEAGFIPEDMFTATEPFTLQNADFKMGGDVDVTLLPPNFPNQRIYASTASGMDEHFYKMYKTFAMHSMAGDKRYACFDIDCDMVINATLDGKVYPVPLLTQETVDMEMSVNPLKATREYKNKFDADGGEDIIIKRAQIIQNSIVRPPELVNTDGSLYMLAYDPAAKKDNSMVGVGKLHRDENRGWMMDIVNCVNLIDKNSRKPLTTPEQVEVFRELVVAYNGQGCGDYENIHRIFIDAGTGGGGTPILQFLYPDFYEKFHDGDESFRHKGLIDYDYPDCQKSINDFPNAANIVSMMEPSKHKVRIFTAAIEMIEQGLVKFPEYYDYHGFLSILSEDGKEEQIYTLSPDEEIALKQIDAMKDEITHIYRYKSSNGNIRYDLAPGLINKMNDDRAYVLALLCGGLAQLRSEDMHKRKNGNQDEELLNFLASSIKRSSLLKK